MRDPAPLTEYALDVRRIPTGLPFDNGDEMDQPTFHALYETVPDGFRAELIEGTVCFKMPAQHNHGRPQAKMATWISNYSAETPETDASVAPTLKLGFTSEPEPDACLFLSPEVGGNCDVDETDYLVGPPELVVEIANTTKATDLGRKKRDYERAGVKEYVVILPSDKDVVWFHRRRDRFVDLALSTDGIFRSICFPGLWLKPEDVFSKSTSAILRTLRLGLASPEHAAFVAALKAKRSKKQLAAKTRVTRNGKLK